MPIGSQQNTTLQLFVVRIEGKSGKARQKLDKKCDRQIAREENFFIPLLSWLHSHCIPLLVLGVPRTCIYARRYASTPRCDTQAAANHDGAMLRLAAQRTTIGLRAHAVIPQSRQKSLDSQRDGSSRLSPWTGRVKKGVVYLKGSGTKSSVSRVTCLFSFQTITFRKVHHLYPYSGKVLKSASRHYCRLCSVEVIRKASRLAERRMQSRQTGT